MVHYYLHISPMPQSPAGDNKKETDSKPLTKRGEATLSVVLLSILGAIIVVSAMMLLRSARQNGTPVVSNPTDLTAVSGQNAQLLPQNSDLAVGRLREVAPTPAPEPNTPQNQPRNVENPTPDLAPTPVQAETPFPEQGIVGWYSMSGRFKDVSGNGNDLTSRNPSPVFADEGVAGLSFKVAGGNDYATAQNLSPFNLSRYTLSFWIKKTSLDTKGFQRAGIPVFLGGALGQFDSSWHHIAIATNGSNSTILYKDRVELARVASPFPRLSTLAQQTTLSQLAAAFRGIIDEVIVYNRVLTAGEVAAITAEQKKTLVAQSMSIQGCYANIEITRTNPPLPKQTPEQKSPNQQALSPGTPPSFTLDSVSSLYGAYGVYVRPWSAESSSYDPDAYVLTTRDGVGNTLGKFIVENPPSYGIAEDFSTNPPTATVIENETTPIDAFVPYNSAMRGFSLANGDAVVLSKSLTVQPCPTRK